MEDLDILLKLLAVQYSIMTVAWYLLEKRKIQNREKRRRWWVSPFISKRATEGSYVKLLKYQPDAGFRLHAYLRLNSTMFEELVQAIGPRVSRKHLVREPISVEERLAVTLRHLATGNFY